jgi:hypothetical protein
MSKKYYPLIREIYSIHAGYGTIGNTFAIPLNQYTIFLNELQIIDSKFQIADADRMFIQVNAPKEVRKNKTNNPQHSLIRCEFMEIIIRIAVCKFYDTKQVKSEAEALDKLVQEHINRKYSYPKCSQYTFRRNQYWNEPVDNVLKAYKPMFMHLYHSYGGTTCKPGEPTFMIASEFSRLIDDARLVNDLFNYNECALMFNQAQVPVADESTSSNHMRCTFIEFLEALTRAMDEASFPLAGDHDLDQSFQMTVAARQNQPVHVKIENAIPNLMMLCSRKFVQKDFTIPVKDITEDLYILPNGKFF